MSALSLRLGRRVALTLVVAVFGTSLPSPAPTRALVAADPPVSVVRLHGTDRFGTAIAVSRFRFPSGSPVVYLTRADQPTDAIALGNPNDGPVLLVPNCGVVPTAVREEIDRLDPARIVTLGGESAVCSTLLGSLTSRTRSIERLSGPSRIDTAIAISRHRFPTGSVDEVNVIRDATAVGALSVAPLASGPILFANPDGTIPASTAAEIDRLGPTRVEVLDDRNAAEVAVGLSQRRVVEPHDDQVVILANETSLADAVTAGSLGEGPLLFVPACSPPSEATLMELDRLRPRRMIVLGGEQAICTWLIDSVLRQRDHAGRPVDLIRRPDVHRVVGVDVIAVYICQVPENSTHELYRRHPNSSRLASSLSAESVARWADRHATEYFAQLSGGRYQIRFEPRGTIQLERADGPHHCLDDAIRAKHPRDTSVLAVDTSRYTGGLGGPGISPYVTSRDISTLSTDNSGRGMYVGGGAVQTDHIWLLHHEIGHTLHWPHSFSDPSNEYDNPVDLMSGNYGLPLAFNLVAAGWIDARQIRVHSSGTTIVDIASLTSPGIRLAVIPHPNRPYDVLTVEHRPRVFGAQSGVAVHLVTQAETGCGTRGSSPCLSMERRQAPAAGSPGSRQHVLQVGQSLSVRGVVISVVAQTADVFSVSITGTRTD